LDQGRLAYCYDSIKINGKIYIAGSQESAPCLKTRRGKSGLRKVRGRRAISDG